MLHLRISYTPRMKAPPHHDQILVCPSCYMKMRVRYVARSGKLATFEKFLTCVNPQCKHVFVTSLLGPFLEGPFPVR
jgi:hypothetical protein